VGGGFEVVLHPVPSAFYRLAPGVLVTPQRLRPGTTVTFTGFGFCPGTTFWFGNTLASAQATVAPDGQSAIAVVPRAATNGVIGVQLPRGLAWESSAGFGVDNFRNTHGFAFVNPISDGITFSDVEELYGTAQTHVTLDPCAWFGGHCPQLTNIPNPAALAYQVVVNELLKGNGMCFGVSLGAFRLFSGARGLGGFPPAGARDPFDLAAPEGPSPQLKHFLNLQHLAQTSLEWIAASFVNWFQHHQAGANGATVLAEVTSILRSGSLPIVIVKDPKSLATWHALLAYDVVDKPGGSFALDVYDPNKPLINTEFDRDGKVHAAALASSEITVAADGSWTFPFGDGDVWRGSVKEIGDVDASVVPSRPTLPVAFSNLTVIIASGEADAPTPVGGSVAYPPVPLPHLDPGADDRPLGWLGDSRGSYELRTRADGAGRVHLAGFGKDAFEQVGVTTSPGATGDVTVRGDGSGVAYRSSAGGSLELALTRTGTDGNGVDVVAQTGPGTRDDVDRVSDGSYIFTHRGPETTIRFTAAAERTAGPTAAVAAVRVGSGDRVLLANPSAAGQLRVIRAGGANSTMRLRPRRLAVQPRIVRLRVQRLSRTSARVALDVRIGAASGVVGVRVAANGHPAVTRSAVLRANGGTASAVLTVPLPPGRYTVDAAVVAVAGGPIPTSAVARASTTFAG
jgi:hypothetical protein